MPRDETWTTDGSTTTARSRWAAEIASSTPTVSNRAAALTTSDRTSARESEETIRGPAKRVPIRVVPTRIAGRMWVGRFMALELRFGADPERPWARCRTIRTSIVGGRTGFA